MTPVKVTPRFRCAYCRRISTKGAMERHEKRCFFNPARYCELCENTGWALQGAEYRYGWVPCPFCIKALGALGDRSERDGLGRLLGEAYDDLNQRCAEAPEIDAAKAWWHGQWGRDATYGLCSWPLNRQIEVPF